MCDLCCIESVKNRMLSRRTLLGGGAAMAATAVAAAMPASAASISISNGKPVDLTHELYPEFPTYFGESGFKMDPKFTYAKEKFNLNVLTINEHTGTHIDAPLHFSENGQSVSEIPVENLVVPLSVIHIHGKASENPDAQVTPEDIKAWISKHGPLPKGGCVAMHSGWSKHVATRKFRNADDKGKMHFPGFHVEATKMLIEDGNTIGMAVDTLSLDHGPSGDFATHYAWLPTNRWGIENITNLEKLPAKGATLFVGAPKHRDGSGGPARIMAIA